MLRLLKVLQGVVAVYSASPCLPGGLGSCPKVSMNIQTLSALTTMPAVQNNLSSRIKTAARETTFVLFFLFGFNVKRLNSLNLL